MRALTFSRRGAAGMLRFAKRGSALLLATIASGFLVLCAGVADAQPQVIKRAAFDQWLAQYRDAVSQLKPGDVLRVADLEKIRPFVPPGYFEQLNFPELRMPIVETRSHLPRKDYVACTAQYQGKARLTSDGTLAGYVCGQPFSNQQLSPEDPQAGSKAAWNFEYRWQNYGMLAINFTFVFDSFGGREHSAIPSQVEMPPQEWLLGLRYQSAMPAALSSFFGGGGSFVRTLSGFYHRVYFSHLAQRADSGGVLKLADAGNFSWKEFASFISPYDMRGHAIIDYRYADPRRPADAWVYALRRVRRVSLEQSIDPVFGSDQTLDDFFSFWGRPTEWNWKFLGWKKLLCVMDSSHDYVQLYGPNGDLIEDVWSLRSFAVVERRSKRPDHPYSSVVMFWDADNWQPWMAIAFDKDQRLWRVWTFQGHWSEDFKSWAELSRGTQTTVLQAQIVSDLENGRATILSGFGVGNPDVTESYIEKRFDLNSLETIHR